MPRIRAITFDWGDTLASNVGMPYQATQRRAFDRLAGDLAALGGSVEGLRERAMAELGVEWRSSVDLQANPGFREIAFDAMLRGWIAASGVDPDAAAGAIERCTDSLADTVIPFAESLPALADLKARGYRLGILSHVPWPGYACRRWFARHGLAAHLDFYALSCEVGFIKPHPDHYRSALDQSGCSAAEILHVGDHPWRDVEGGGAFGFRTCLRLTEGIYTADRLAACRPDGEILHLDEVAELAARLSA